MSYGIWGNGLINVNANFNNAAPYYKGWRFIFIWHEFETSSDVFDYNYIKDQLDIAIAHDWDFGLQINISPSNTGSPNTPAYLFSAPYNVPKITTSTGGEYPYYLNSNFITRYLNMHEKLREYLSSLSSTYTNRLKFWLSSEGKTGDTGPYGGTVTSVTINGVTQPNPSAYEITDSDWETYKRNNVWSVLSPLLATDLPNCSYAINGGVNFQSFQWGIDNIPGCSFKTGYPTHTYSNGFEKYYSQYIHELDGSSIDQGRCFGEFQDTQNASWWTPSQKQNAFALFCSNLHHGVSALCFNPNISNTLVGTDFRGHDFFNRHAGQRTPYSSGFCQLRDMIDVASNRFPTSAPYGPIIDPSKLASYTAQYNSIIADSADSKNKQFRITNLTIDDINPSRITYIRTLFPGTSFHTLDNDQDQDAYNQEYIVDGIADNYFRYITQYSPNTTSKGVWRLGPTTDFYGRYARSFDYLNSKTEMFFTVDEGLSGSSNNSNITITYYDNGGVWSLNTYTCRGKAEVQVVQCKNTSTWKTIVVNIPDFQFGGNLDNSSDFTLKYLSGSDTSFSLIEFENLSK